MTFGQSRFIDAKFISAEADPVQQLAHQATRRVSGTGLWVDQFSEPEAGKGDHRHFGAKESSYSFSTPEALLADFQRDIARWNRENSDS